MRKEIRTTQHQFSSFLALNQTLTKTKTAQHDLLAVSGKFMPLRGSVPNHLP